VTARAQLGRDRLGDAAGLTVGAGVGDEDVAHAIEEEQLSRPPRIARPRAGIGDAAQAVRAALDPAARDAGPARYERCAGS
jgi:hypothetical protein